MKKNLLTIKSNEFLRILNQKNPHLQFRDFKEAIAEIGKLFEECQDEILNSTSEGNLKKNKLYIERLHEKFSDLEFTHDKKFVSFKNKKYKLRWKSFPRIKDARLKKQVYAKYSTIPKTSSPEEFERMRLIRKIQYHFFQHYLEKKVNKLLAFLETYYASELGTIPSTEEPSGKDDFTNRRLVLLQDLSGMMPNKNKATKIRNLKIFTGRSHDGLRDAFRELEDHKKGKKMSARFYADMEFVENKMVENNL